MFEALIDTLKSNPGGTHQERKRHDGSSSNNSAPCEDDVNPQTFVKKLAHSTASTEKFQKKQAGCHRWKHEWQCHQSLQQKFSWPTIASERPSHGQTKWQNQQSTESAHSQRETNNLTLSRR
jgi:hypothetical protein